MTLRDLIGLGLARKLGITAAIEHHLEPTEAYVTPEGGKPRGPYYTNRAMRRARGERGYGFGYGAMAPSIRTRGRA